MMRELFKRVKINFIVASIFCIVLGLVLLFWPGISSTVICYAFGGILLIYGLITIIGFLVCESRAGGFRLDLLLGIVLTAVGIVFLLHPQFILSILPVFFGLYVVFDSLINLRRALELRRLGFGKWPLALALSLAAAALGLLILFNPFPAAATAVAVIGAILVYQGISDLWSIGMVTRLGRQIKKAVTPIECDYTVLDDERK